MRKLTILVIALAVVAGMVASLLFLKPPRPEIVLAAEEIFAVGSFTVANTVITAWIVILLLVLLSWRATRRMQEVPSGLQNLMEAGLEGFLGLVEGIAGKENGRRFFPLVATILIYVMISNWFGLLPGVGTIGKVHEEEHGAVFQSAGSISIIPFKPEEVDEGEGHIDASGHVVVPHGEGEAAHVDEADLVRIEDDEKLGVLVPFLRGVNTDLNATMGLALTAVLTIQFWGFRSLGLRGYGGKFINLGGFRRGPLMGAIEFGVGLLEIISEIARIVSFTFRLFGNIFAGEVLVVIITFLMPLFLILPFYGLELFVGFIQAFVFAMLTLVFASLAVASHGGHDEKHEADVAHPPMTAGTGPQGAH